MIQVYYYEVNNVTEPATSLVFIALLSTITPSNIVIARHIENSEFAIMLQTMTLYYTSPVPNGKIRVYMHVSILTVRL